MKRKKTILIICREISEIKLLFAIQPKAEYRYVIASDDIRVHKIVKKYPWISEVSWIEQMESFYNVADDVINLLEVVNRWLKSLADEKKGLPAELLFWIRHCEGGMTSQRIQDLLLLICSYQYLIETYSVENIFILSHPGLDWEDKVFIQTARGKGVDVKIIGSFRPKVLISKILALLKIYAREIYFIFNFVRAKLRNYFKIKKVKHYDKEIVFQLWSSGYKHVANIIPLMKATKERGYNPVALCWCSHERYRKCGAEQVRQEGLLAEELEKWTPLSSIWKGHYRIYRTWQRAKTRKNEFLFHPKLQYRSVPLGDLLWPSIHFFFRAELPQRYRVWQAVKNYFIFHSPLAIKIWGPVAFFEGFITWKYLNKKMNPIVFDYALGSVLLKWPYDPPEQPVDLFLVAGDSTKNLRLQEGFPSEQIVAIGQPRYGHLDVFKKNYNPSQSRTYLKIPLDYRFFILFDLNSVLRGFLTNREQIEIIASLLNFVKKNPTVALIIKPHQRYHSGIVDSFINDYSLKNVFFVDKNTLPYHAINAADIVITKFSAIGIEAMLFSRPLISYLLDNEPNFKFFENAAEYVFTTDELNDLLCRLITNNEFRKEWTLSLIDKQRQFLERNLSIGISQSSSQVGAEAIDAFIKKKQKISLKLI